MANEYIIVQTHTNKKHISEIIAETLIKKRLAACVNLYPTNLSMYCYNDKLVRDEEVLIHAKTTSDRFSEVERVIEELHNYETPEIISIEISNGSIKYLRWLKNEVRAK